MKPTFCGGSSSREGSRSGRSAASSESSATRAARFAERTDAKGAPARTSVPAAAASAEIVVQSATAASLRLVARPLHERDDVVGAHPACVSANRLYSATGVGARVWEVGKSADSRRVFHVTID